MVAVACARRGRSPSRNGPARRRRGTGLGRTQPGSPQGQRAAGPVVRSARFVAGSRGSSGGRPRLVAPSGWRCHTAVGRRAAGHLQRGGRKGKRRKGCPAASASALPRSAAGAGGTGPRADGGERTGAAVHDGRRAPVRYGRRRAGRGAHGRQPIGVRGRRRGAAARGDRDGQVRRAGTELRQRRRRHLRRRERTTPSRPGWPAR